MQAIRTYLNPLSARAIIGFSLCWAWIDTALVGAPLARDLTSNGMLDDLASMVSVLSCLLTYALCYASPRLASLLCNRTAAWLVALAAALGTVLVCLHEFCASPLFALPGLALIGIGMALLVLMWADDYANDEEYRGYIWVAGSIALSFPLYLFVAELSPWMQTIAVATLPLASRAFLRINSAPNHRRRRHTWIEKAASTEVDERYRILGFTSSLAFWFFSFGFVFGIMQHFSAPNDPSLTTLAHFQQSGRAIAAVIFFVGPHFLSWKPHTAYRISTIIVLAGLVLLPIFGSNNAFAAGFLAHVAYGFFECMTWAIIFETMRLQKSEAATVAGAARLLSALGLFLGTLLVVCARDLFDASTLQMQSILSSAVCMLVIAVMMVLSNNKDTNVWAMMKAASENAITRSGSSLDAASALLGSSQGLTEREIQILALLAEGRTSPYISKELFIGVNTVNTHKRRIYQKLGVHNKQELIDKVRATAEATYGSEPVL